MRLPSLPLAVALALAGLIATPLAAQTASKSAASKSAIEVRQPWTRVTSAGQGVGAGYLTLRNPGAAADRLLSATTPAAERVELHSMAMEGDVMRMRRVESVEVPAGSSVELKPGGLHLMLLGLKRPLQAGQPVPLTLRFEKAGEVPVQLQVQSSSAPAHDRGAASSGHEHEHKHGHDHSH